MANERKVYPRPVIPNGRYQHYKGGFYDVYGLSQQEATGIWDVLYRNPYSGECFHRPASEWPELVNGAPRFKLVG
jgi:hypothetical protein